MKFAVPSSWREPMDKVDFRFWRRRRAKQRVSGEDFTAESEHPLRRVVRWPLSLVKQSRSIGKTGAINEIRNSIFSDSRSLAFPRKATVLTNSERPVSTNERSIRARRIQACLILTDFYHVWRFLNDTVEWNNHDSEILRIRIFVRPQVINNLLHAQRFSSHLNNLSEDY